MKKQIWIVLLAVVMAVTLLACVACVDPKPATYTLTYAAGEGTGTAPEAKKYEAGAEITLINNPFTAPANKEFDGWMVEGVKKAAGDKVTMPEKDITITAQWKTTEQPQPEKWTVTFKNEAETVSTVEVVKGQKLTASQIPTLTNIPENKEFAGWFIENTETEVTVDTAITGNIVVVAKLTDKQVTPPEVIPDEAWIGTFDFCDSLYEYVLVIALDGDTLTAKLDINEPVEATLEVVDGKQQITFDNGATGSLRIEYCITLEADGTFTMIGSDEDDYEIAKRSTTPEPSTVTVTFKVGTQVVKTVELEKGDSILKAQFPADPTSEGDTFLGWYLADGETKLQIGAEITENITVTAKFQSNSWIVTFVNGQSSVTCKADKTTGLVKDAPSDPELAPAGKTFLGWYNGTTKYTSTTKITADATFTAMFAGKEDYVGAWYNDEEAIKVVFDVNSSQAKIVSLNTKVKDKVCECVDGTVTFTEGSFSSKHTYSLVVIGDKMILTDTYYDSIEESNVTDTHILNKGEAVDFAGSYKKDRSSVLTVVDGGVLTSYNSNIWYGRIVQNGNDWNVIYKTSDTGSIITLPLNFDEKGNIVVLDPENKGTNSYKGLWVKDSTVSEYYYCDSDYLYVHTVSGSKLYVFSNLEKQEYCYATITSGELAQNNVLIIDLDGKTVEIKIISSTKFVYAGAEKGTYTVGDETIILDGFGGASIGEATDQKYHTVIENVIVIGDKAFRINADKSTTVLTADAVQGDYIKGSNTITLDGFGGVIYDSYGTLYYGLYTVDQTSVIITGDVSCKGTYTIEQNGEVLLTGNSAYVKRDCTIDSKINEFLGEHNGFWTSEDGATIEISIDPISIIVDGMPNSASSNWNGTLLYFHNGKWSSESQTSYFRIADGKLVCEVRKGYENADGELISTTTFNSAEKLEEPDKPAHNCVGTWTATFFGGKHTIVLEANGTVKYDSEAQSSIWTANGENRIKWTYGGEYDFVFVVGGASPSIELEQDGTSISVSNVTFTPAQSGGNEPELDAFAGTWTFGDWSLNFDGQGKVLVNNGSTSATVDYSITGEKVTFTFNSQSFEGTIANDKLHLIGDPEDFGTHDFTKQV